MGTKKKKKKLLYYNLRPILSVTQQDAARKFKEISVLVHTGRR